MKCIINDQVVLLRAPEGPLAVHIASFAEWASEQGYTLGSLRQRVRIAAGFSQWLADKAIRLRSVEAAPNGSSDRRTATVSVVAPPHRFCG